jgi:hypothetical protein
VRSQLGTSFCEVLRLQQQEQPEEPAAKRAKTSGGISGILEQPGGGSSGGGSSSGINDVVRAPWVRPEESISDESETDSLAERVRCLEHQMGRLCQICGDLRKSQQETARNHADLDNWVHKCYLWAKKCASEFPWQ